MERFFLPVGQYTPSAFTSEGGHYAYFRQQLRIAPDTFGPERVAAGYSFAPDSRHNPGIFDVFAIWPGFVQVRTNDGMVVVEMLPSTRLALAEQLGDDVPVPARATYGPVLVDRTLPGVVWEGTAQAGLATSGAKLGRLAGEMFSVGLEDQDGFFLDPLAYFQLFEQMTLWALPNAVRCPLIPDDQVWRLSAVAPDIPPAGDAYLVLAGGSRNATIYNPPDVVRPVHFSFLSSDLIRVDAPGLGSGAILTVTDESDPARRTRGPRSFVEPLDAPVSFVLQDRLPPFHPPYARANGVLTPAPPLRYRLEATDGTTTLGATIEQDAKDVVRQEFVFHGSPFQTNFPPLPPPAREHVERNTFGSERFPPTALETHNYGPTRGNWIVNGWETTRVLEYVRRQVAERLDAVRAADPAAAPLSIGADLEVTGAWRNPERNEAIGDGADSDHQYGLAVDVKSKHRKTALGFVEGNVLLNELVFDAGKDFLQALVAASGAANCARSEVTLVVEHPSDRHTLWRYAVDQAGTVGSAIGDGYAAGLGPPPADTTQALRHALGSATHVHIGWAPADPAVPLTVPDPSPYGDVPVNVPLRNLIVIMADDVSVAPDKQLPLNHVAASLKEFLEEVDPLTRTDVIEVRNTWDYLLLLGAIGGETYEIRYFFSMSHAWPGGLVLTEFDESVPYLRPAGGSGPQRHDERVHELLSQLYGYSLDVGPLDTTQIRTNQFRISNLRWLPDEYRRRMRRTFANAQGIYILGCRNADEDDVNPVSFTRELANTLGKSVYGAAFKSKVLGRSLGQWTLVDVGRQDPRPSERPLVLVPAAGREHFELYLKRLDNPGTWDVASPIPPPIPIPPQTTDLFVVYRGMLTRVDPDTR